MFISDMSIRKAIKKVVAQSSRLRKIEFPPVSWLDLVLQEYDCLLMFSYWLQNYTHENYLTTLRVSNNNKSIKMG